MNSIIEAQVTFKEELNKEIERCRSDPYYMYITYYCIMINGKVTFPIITREQFNYYTDIANNKPKPIYHRRR